MSGAAVVHEVAEAWGEEPFILKLRIGRVPEVVAMHILAHFSQQEQKSQE